MGSPQSSLRARLWVAGVVGGFSAIAVLVVVVLQYGRFDPSPPALRAQPNPAIPGEILYFDDAGCIVRARASGERREQVSCGVVGGYGLTWVDANTIAFSEPGRSGPPTWTELDLGTKKTRETTRSAEPQRQEATSPKGERAIIGNRGEISIARDSERTEIVDFDVPEYGGPALVTWSPDGEWLLLHYTPRRGDHGELWIVSRDGKVQGTLAADLPPWGPPWASWWIDGAGFLPAVRR